MIAIINYGAGNTASVANALCDFNFDVIVTNKKEDLKIAEKIIFPGVGEASFAMHKLKELDLLSLISGSEKPLLGICLGMQLLCSHSEEGNTDCIGVLDDYVKKFRSDSLKVPHMGWNKVRFSEANALFRGIKQDSYFYFAHSYYIPSGSNTVAESSHGLPFSAAIQKNNFYAVQFHPEKSGEAGLLILKNFMEL